MMEDVDVTSLYTRKVARWALMLVLSALALLVTILVTICIGSVSIPLEEVGKVFLGGEVDPAYEAIILKVRLPRVLLGGLVGASLAVAGAGMQGLFRNPMASPYVLGLSSGAAFGASLAIVLGLTFVPGGFAVPAMAFVFAFLTLFIVYSIAKVKGRIPVETLLLSGIAVGAFFSALVSFMKYMADDKLETIVFWMMGGLWNASWDSVLLVIPFIIVGAVIILLFSRDLNTMMIGEEHAVNLGVNTPLVTKGILLGSSLVTAAAVSVSGIIGFVGLVVPHILRILVGPDHRILIPTSIIVGAAFMIWMDTLARTIMAPEELPVGIITALLGAPFFIYLLRTRKKMMGW